MIWRESERSESARPRKIGFDRFLTAVTDQQGDQALLRLGALGSGPLGEQLFLESARRRGFDRAASSEDSERFPDCGDKARRRKHRPWR